MATPSTAPPLSERADIHKSCKAIETLLNTLSDYCEAVGVVVSLQKKLAKSLKETATLKATGDIASNAMQASATIFEGLSDVDSKFSKIVDKEYDAISTEVKKWFKKLAKEEKAHDERVATINARIKQAGQAYEKKAKRKNSDASDEHTRYINLISSLGPEVTQTKYNHTVSVSQGHTAATYSVAASLARLSDAEWQKSCECIRRFAPTIGPLVKWRALCEGGWTGPLPSDLPNLTDAPPEKEKSSNDNDYDNPTPPTTDSPLNRPRPSSPLRTIQEDARQETLLEPPLSSAPQQSHEDARRASAEHLRPPPSRGRSPVPSSSSTDNLHSAQGSRPESPSHSALPSPIKVSSPSFPSPNVGLPPNDDDNSRPEAFAARQTHQTDRFENYDRLEAPSSLAYLDAQNTGSIRSLSAFPSPPTHVPLPPPASLPSATSRHPNMASSSSSSNRNVSQGVRFVSGSSNTSGGNARPFAESPVSDQGFPSQTHGYGQEQSDQYSPRTRADQYQQEQSQLPSDQFTSSTAPLEIRRPVPIAARSSNSILTTSREELEPEHQADRGHPSSAPDAGFGNRSDLASPGGQGRNVGSKGHMTTASLDRRPLGRTQTQREDQFGSSGDDGRTTREFGVMDGGGTSKSRTYAGVGVGGGYREGYDRVERTDTGTSSVGSGSIVAAMRSRYSSNPTIPTSPPPNQHSHSHSLPQQPLQPRETRELPRIPLPQGSVNNIAARYERSNDGPSSPPPRDRDITRTLSPPGARRSVPGTSDSASSLAGSSQGGGGVRRVPSLTSPSREGWRSKEQELKERERELEIRERELRERLQSSSGGDRDRLQPVREDVTGGPTPGMNSGHAGHTGSGSGSNSGSASGATPSWLRPQPRERRPSLKAQLSRPLSQMSLDGIDAPLPSIRQQQQHLVPPSSGSNVHTPPSSNSPMHSPSLQQQRRVSPLGSPRGGGQPLPPLSPGGRYERRISTDRERERYGDDAYESTAYQRGAPPREGGRQGPRMNTSEPHAPYCGCEACSISKYKSPSSASLQSPGARSSGATSSILEASNSMSSSAASNSSITIPNHQPTDGKGTSSSTSSGKDKDSTKSGKPNWIRRLSMPVGQAFSLSSSSDKESSSKKHTQQQQGGGANLTRGPSTSSSLYSLIDPKRNMSAVALRSSSSMAPVSDVQEDGRLQRPGTAGGAGGGYHHHGVSVGGRRSYEVGGMTGNRSMTNLNGGGGGGSRY